MSVVDSVATQHPVPPSWAKTDDGVERMTLVSSSVSSTHLLLYAFDPTKFSFTFEFSTSSKSVVDWHVAYPAATAVLNATYFSPDQSPSGYLAHAGQRIGKSSFDLDKSAFLELSPEVLIQATAQKLPDAKKTPEIAQSYPLLIQDGQARVTTDSGQVARRTFAAIRSDHQIIFGVVADGALSLYQLSHELTQPSLHIETAINLDGGPSTGISVKTSTNQEEIDSFVPVPISIIVTRLASHRE